MAAVVRSFTTLRRSLESRLISWATRLEPAGPRSSSTRVIQSAAPPAEISLPTCSARRSRSTPASFSRLARAGHSNGYATILRCIFGNDPTSCNLGNGHGNNNAFAMEWGGGLDIALSSHVQIRPIEVDYLYTNFSSNHVAHIANSQNSFKYFAGVNFTLGGK